MSSMDFPDSLRSINKILIVGPAWIGDMMMAQSLFKLLKQRNSSVTIDLLASAWTRPLLACMPEVNQVIEMPLGHGVFGLGERRRLGKSLRGKGYEQAIVLPNSFKSALIPFFADIPLRTGWRGEMRYGLLNDIRVLDKARYPLMVQRYVALGYPGSATPPQRFPFPRLSIDPSHQQALFATFDLHSDKPVLVLCPGAEYGPAKRWPEAYYAQVAADRIDTGWQVWLMGSAKDKPVAQAIINMLSQAQQRAAVNLAGNTTLGQAIELMTCAKAVVTNDSGLMHIAAALEIPSVVLFGSTSAEHTPPLSDCVKSVSLALECSPCFERECPLQHHKCLRDLHPDQVIQALSELLGESQTLTIRPQ